MTCKNCDPELNKAERIIKTNKQLTHCAICNDLLIGRIGQYKPMRRVLILGIDGYIGWALALELLYQGYTVAGIDNYSRRRRVREVGSESLTPIACRLDRLNILKEYHNYHDLPGSVSLHDNSIAIVSILKDFQPDSIIHLAEQPSAPWSMKSPAFASITQEENVIGTLNLLWAMKQVSPDAHLIKLGTMGEYGTPNCVIPEGEIPEQCMAEESPGISAREVFGRKCPMATLPFPRSPGSFYHLSKVHDTHNVIFACKTWNLTSTDIMQGVVYGLHRTEPNLITRFDYDQYFGTVINRFCAQAICGHPLTIYGTGQQLRGYLPLKDSLQCIQIAIDNPPMLGTYRTFNQYESVYSVNNLANIVVRRSKLLGLKVQSIAIPNPRTESNKHTYKPVSEGLRELGYIPSTDIKHEIHDLLSYLMQYAHSVNQGVIKPTTDWR